MRIRSETLILPSAINRIHCIVRKIMVWYNIGRIRNSGGLPSDREHSKNDVACIFSTLWLRRGFPVIFRYSLCQLVSLSLSPSHWFARWCGSMDHITIKTPNLKCRLYWCFIEFIDCRYRQSSWYFRPAPLTCSLVSSPPPLPPGPSLCE